MPENRSILEDRVSTLAPMIKEPAAPGTGAPGGKDGLGVVSLVYPSPDVAGDSRKWGIAQKNILSRIDEVFEVDGEGTPTDEAETPDLNARGAAKLRAWVEAMEPEKLPTGGFALYTDGDDLSAVSLEVRPLPTLHKGEIFAMPALVDAASTRRYWCVALDAEQPRLFYVSGRTWTDKTPEDAPSLSERMGKTVPMATVSFHSSGKPHIGSAAHASAKFHALGTATGDLKRDEIERVLGDFARQVGTLTKGSTDPVLIVGDPKNCGLFREHYDHPQAIEDDLQVGGDALEMQELAMRAHEAVMAWDDERKRARLGDLDRNTLRTGTTELLSAAREGRIEHVYLREDAAGLLTGDDERLKIDAAEDEGAEARSMIVTEAVKNGAQLTVFEAEMADDLPEIAAVMRY